jgi:hypothetical protein
LRCGFDFQLPADAAKVALDSSRVIVQVLCDGFEGAQFHEGMQYLRQRVTASAFKVFVIYGLKFIADK